VGRLVWAAQAAAVPEAWVARAPEMAKQAQVAVAVEQERELTRSVATVVLGSLYSPTDPR
jgi:hypothetical protein